MTRNLCFQNIFPFIDVFRIMKSMGEFQLIGVEGERRKKLSDMRLGKKLQVYLLMLPKNGLSTKKKYACKSLLVRNCVLHPLICTLLEFNLAQNLESIDKRSRSSAVLFGK